MSAHAATKLRTFSVPRVTTWMGYLFLSFLCARAGLLFSSHYGQISPLWPPSGICLALLCLRGTRNWTGVMAGLALAPFTVLPWPAVQMSAGSPEWLASALSVVRALGTATLVGLVASTEALLGRWILMRAFTAKGRVDSIAGVLAILVTALVAPIPAALLGPLLLSLGGVMHAAQWVHGSAIWWAGDALGILLFTPFLMAWFSAPRPRWNSSRAAELALVAVLFWLLSESFLQNNAFLPLLILPVLIGTALRYGQRGATAAMLVLSAITMIRAGGAYLANGPDGASHLSPPSTQFLLWLQTFLVSVGGTVYLVAAGANSETQRRTLMRRAEAEALLTQARAQLKELVERVPGMVWEFFWDPDTGAKRETFVSPHLKELLDYELADFGQRENAWTNLFFAEDLARNEFIRALVERRDDGPNSSRYRLRRKNGDTIWVESRVQKIRDAHGRLRGFRGITMDVTHTQQLESERADLLRQTQAAVQARDEIFAVVTHDLRTPLSSIQMNAGLLKRCLPAAAMDGAGTSVAVLRAVPAEILGGAAASILASLSLVNRLIEDLVEAREMECAELSTHMVNFDPAQPLNQAIELMAPVAEARAVGLRCGSLSQNHSLTADPKRLTQALVNLLANALQFSPPHSEVWISSRTIAAEPGSHAGAWIEYAVSDQGPGFDLAQRERLFERHWQGETSATRRPGSVGLGLHIVRAIAVAHGGEVEAEQNLPRGSVFKIRVPLVDTARPAESPRPTPAAQLCTAQQCQPTSDK